MAKGQEEQAIEAGLKFLQTDKGQKLVQGLVGHMDELRRDMEPSMDPAPFYKMLGQLISNTTFEVAKSGSELSDGQLESVAGGVSSFGYIGFAQPVSLGGFSRLGGASLGLKINLSAVTS